MNISYSEKYILYLTSKTEPLVKIEIQKKDNFEDILSSLGIDSKRFWLIEVQRITYENKKIKGVNKSNIIAKSIVFRRRLDKD